MGIHERRDRERSQTRSLIMDTARRLFAAEGYQAVSMRRIADAIEYSPTAIYVHFKDKESLIREICTEDFGKLAQESLRLAQVKDPVERIRLVGLHYIRFAVEHPNQYKLMFMTETSNEQLKQLSQADLQRKGNPEEDAYAFLLQTVTEAMNAGRFRPELTDVQLVAQTFWAIVHGVASLQITMANDPWIDWASLEARTECAINASLSGLVAGRKSWFGCPIANVFNRKRAGK